jgi:RNA polymerase sigma-70 factor (ECF subfamily)
MHTTPHSLLERLRALAQQPAAQAAWVRFVELYTPLLVGWARRLRLAEDDAADLAQEVLTHLVRRLPEFRHDGRHRFRSWLRTVLLNRYRDRRAGPPAAAADLGEFVDHAALDPADAAEEAEYRHYLLARALAIMQRDFEPATWQACWLTKVQGRPAADVARDLGMTVPAVHAATYTPSSAASARNWPAS